MTAPTFPIVALLPDLWTVREVATRRPVSQHATAELAHKHCVALANAGSYPLYALMLQRPEHGPEVVIAARAAIWEAQRRAACSDTRSHWIVCGCCQLWHDPDADCPPPQRPSPYGDPNT